ncbi:MAG: hypothetical protein HXX08_05955 [Chloroflexi bacterium]|uniref:Fibronectin type-III domain-containing protein n=1 Tax=Candidatus Chlorohelix allophototropha TaxID=3003348 RepID=A0A8T7M2M7_9CHLR|nr:hypothetical protein [Chloroflexota bacterium]WJW67278.1 hypothetical protein OZ401_000538 [Chloroflexota bacterium L227-S17]
MRKTYYRAALLLVILLLLQLAFNPLITQGTLLQDSSNSAIPGTPLILVTDGQPNPVKVAPPLNFSRRMAKSNSVLATPTATFSVTYNGFSAQAQAAFQYALDIWATQITSPVPITINAYWTNLQTCSSGQACILGAAGPYEEFQDFSGATLNNTLYAAALANKLHRSDIDPVLSDIIAQFNSGYPDWYYGTDGNTPLNKIDFVSVVLHEIGHGLGFFGDISYNTTTFKGSYGYPAIYDRFAVNGSGQSLLNTTLFPNPSTALGSQLVSNNLYFDSPTVREINGSNTAKLYAPSPWEQGSSYSHLDNIYNGTPNALMTYSIGTGEVQHNPGSLILAMFRDMGWTVALTPNDPTLLVATPFSSTRIDLTWHDNSSYETNYRIERSPNGSSNWSSIAMLPASSTSYSDTGLFSATLYYYRVLASNLGVDSGYSNTANATTNTGTIWTVTSTEDSGDTASKGTDGTLSYALNQATNGHTIKFLLNGGATTINVSGALRAVQAGVIIDGGACTSGTGITIMAKPDMAAATDITINGLVLGGATIRNITVSGFGGRQIVANPGRDILYCSKGSKK